MIPTKNHGQKLKKKTHKQIQLECSWLQKYRNALYANPWAVWGIMCMERKNWEDSPSLLVWKSEWTWLQAS